MEAVEEYASGSSERRHSTQIRRRSSGSCRKNFAATALLTNVRDADAGATRLTLALLTANSSEKKLSAMQITPTTKRTLPTTARIAPSRPDFAFTTSRSPILRMAEAVSTSPAVAVSTMAAIIAALCHAGEVMAGPPSLLRASVDLQHASVRYKTGRGSQIPPLQQ